ncbi:MAG: hypothetical protein CMM94_01460 [Rickettsiales bacterium]|nr:hypothetical protein [Rickettsiales bacterium]
MRVQLESMPDDLVVWLYEQAERGATTQASSDFLGDREQSRQWSEVLSGVLAERSYWGNSTRQMADGPDSRIPSYNDTYYSALLQVHGMSDGRLQTIYQNLSQPDYVDRQLYASGSTNISQDYREYLEQQNAAQVDAVGDVLEERGHGLSEMIRNSDDGLGRY